MIHGTIRGVAALAVITLAAACASDDAKPEAAANDKPETVSANEADAHESAKSAPESNGNMTAALDPDQALAAIPTRMRPAMLLPTLKSKLLVPDLANGGVAMFSDIMTIAPGEDVTYCTYLQGATSEVTHIHNTRGSQSLYGHHAILQYTTTPQEPGTRPCSLETIEGQQGQIIGGTGGEGTTNIELPSNVVSEIPAGSQFIINHHWINWAEEPREVQAEMITIPPKRGDELLIARALSIVVADFSVAPGEIADHSGECEFKEDMDMLSMIGHEHRWGTHVKAERMRDETDVIFDHDYNEDMVSHPLTKSYTVDEPFHFRTGDRVRMGCRWNNTSGGALTFPHEMCILFGWRLGGDSDSVCYNGRWMSR